MIYNEVIQGKYVKLRSVCIEDAKKIIEIRQDPLLTKYLPKLDISVDMQKEWIEKQRKRDGDYYFVVINMKEEIIGTIRIYNIVNDIGETGSLALGGNAFENLEAKLLCEEFQWNILKLKETRCVIHVDNIQAQKFAKRFGVEFDEPVMDQRGFMCLVGYNDIDKSVPYRENIKKLLYKSIG